MSLVGVVGLRDSGQDSSSSANDSARGDPLPNCRPGSRFRVIDARTWHRTVASPIRVGTPPTYARLREFSGLWRVSGLAHGLNLDTGVSEIDPSQASLSEQFLKLPPILELDASVPRGCEDDSDLGGDTDDFERGSEGLEDGGAAQLRPRERLLLEGASLLSDAELLAVVMGGGRAHATAVALLEAHGGLHGLAQCVPEEYCETRGVGRARACAMAATIELGRRFNAGPIEHLQVIDNPSCLADYVRARLRGSTSERFMIVGLDARRRVRLFRTVAVGSVARVEVHPREIFRPLIRAGMSACVLAHNHPSGVAEPSRADVELTARMLGVGRLVGIPVVDHVIVADHESVSLAELGMLRDPAVASMMEAE